MNNNLLQSNHDNMIRYAHPNLAIFCAWWTKIFATSATICFPCLFLLLLAGLFNFHLLVLIFFWPIFITGSMGIIHFVILIRLIRCDKCGKCVLIDSIDLKTYTNKKDKFSCGKVAHDIIKTRTFTCPKCHTKYLVKPFKMDKNGCLV